MASSSPRQDAPAASTVSLVSAADMTRIYDALLSSGRFSREQIAEQAGLAVATATAEQYPVSATSPAWHCHCFNVILTLRVYRGVNMEGYLW
jgi:hypothetical protein